MTARFESTRLYFRQLTLADAKLLFQLNADHSVIRYTGDSAFESIEAAKTFIQTYTDYELHGIGRWAIVLKDTQQTIGWCGLKYTAALHEVDLGFRLFLEEWGKGYATEAGIGSLRCGFEVMQFEQTVGRVWKINLASQRVLEKCGLKFWKDAIFDEEAGSYYKITKSEYGARFSSPPQRD